MQATSSTTIKVNVPTGILLNSQDEAARIGISLQDFIRLLMATYFSRSESITAISRDKMLLKQAKSEVAAGKFTTLKSKAALNKRLLSL